MDALLEIEDLKKYYGKEPNQTKALNGITFQVMPGEFLGIMGSSGSGKSTLLNCIATVIQPDSGKIRMKGTEIQRLKGKKLAGYRGKEIGYLFQNFELLDNLTGRENILLPTSLHSVPEKESRTRLKNLSEYLEITAAGVEKSEGLKTLCGKLGISPEEAAAFGDGESDLSMMRAAGFGVAMGNAPENVRRRAPMVIGKNDEEGLLKRLKEIFKD